MSLKSTICDIVHHACRTQAHYPTMVSSFKLSLGTVCLPRFCCTAGHNTVYKEKFKTCVNQPDALLY